MPLIISSLSFFEMPFSTAHHSSRNRISRHCTVYPFGVCHEPILASETHDHYLTLRRSSPRPFIDALHTGLLSLSVHRHNKPSTTLATHLTVNPRPSKKSSRVQIPQTHYLPPLPKLIARREIPTRKPTPSDRKGPCRTRTHARTLLTTV